MTGGEATSPAGGETGGTMTITSLGGGGTGATNSLGRPPSTSVAAGSTPSPHSGSHTGAEASNKPDALVLRVDARSDDDDVEGSARVPAKDQDGDDEDEVVDDDDDLMKPADSSSDSTTSSARAHALAASQSSGSLMLESNNLLIDSVDTIRDTMMRLVLFFTFKSTLEPNGHVRIVWDWFIIVLALYNFFLTPFYTAFNTELGHTLYGFEWFVTSCFLLDILVNFRTGYVDYSGLTIFDERLIADRYIRSYLALDLLGAFPFHIISPPSTSALPHQFVDNCLKINFILRSSKVVNSPRIDAFISPQARIGKLLFGFFCLAHLFGCIFFFVGEVQTTDTTWITAQGLQNKGRVEQYIASLYWSLATMVTVGYGDIVPVTVYEQATVIPILMLSALIYATIFGNMHYAIETLTSTIRRYQSRMDSVKEFVKVYELPPSLSQKLTDYTNAMWSQNKGFETSEMLSHLPTSVRADIMMYIQRTLIERVPLFKQCSDRFLEAMILRMTSQVCLADDYIFKEGDKSREMYFVRSGSVQIIMEIQGVDQVIAEIGSYSDYPFFGEISLLLGETRTASARASTKCVLSKLSQQDFFEVLSMFPEEENSLRETATLRLEQDIEREAKALKKRERQQAVQAKLRPMPLLTGTRPEPDSSQSKHESGEGGDGRRYSIQLTPVAGSKAENRLRSLEGGSTTVIASGSNSPQLSPASSPAVNTAPLEAPMVHSRLNKLNSANVRRSLFVAHGGLSGGLGIGGIGGVGGANTFNAAPLNIGISAALVAHTVGANAPSPASAVTSPSPITPSLEMTPVSASGISTSPEPSPDANQQLVIDVSTSALPSQSPVGQSSQPFDQIAEEEEEEEEGSGSFSMNVSPPTQQTQPPQRQHSNIHAEKYAPPTLHHSTSSHGRSSSRLMGGSTSPPHSSSTPTHTSVPSIGALDALAALRKSRDGVVEHRTDRSGSSSNLALPAGHSRNKLSGVMSRLVLLSQAAENSSPKQPNSASSDDDSRRVPGLALTRSAGEAVLEDKVRTLESKLEELTRLLHTVAPQTAQPGAGHDKDA